MAGSTFSSLDLSGVLTRFYEVPGYELAHIAPEDRAYVSSEMSAFLLAWLSSLPCAVLNRPTPGCLCGPNWRVERWINLAATMGIPVDPVRRSTTTGGVDQAAEEVRVTVVGDACLGEVHPALQDHARRLARASHLELLEVRFSTPDADGRLRSASLWPDISRPAVADALLRRFDSGAP